MNDRKPHIDKKKLLLKLLFLFSPTILFIAHHIVLYGLEMIPNIFATTLLLFLPLLVMAGIYYFVIATKRWSFVTVFHAVTLALNFILIFFLCWFTYAKTVYQNDKIIGEAIFTAITCAYLIAVIIYFMIDSYRIVKKERGSFSIKKTKNIVGENTK